MNKSIQESQLKRLQTSKATIETNVLGLKSHEERRAARIAREKKTKVKGRFSRFIKFFILLVLAYLAYFIYQNNIPEPEYSLAGDRINILIEPFQKKIKSGEVEEINIVTDKNNYTLKPMAYYDISALVVGKRQYNDSQSDIAKYDLALIWGDLTSEDNLELVRYTQSNRWYHFWTENIDALSVKHVSERSANNHIIPANKNIEDAVKLIRKKNEIRLQGYLVNVHASLVEDEERGFNTRTSLRRTDSGDGSCEVIYVIKLILDGKIYE